MALGTPSYHGTGVGGSSAAAVIASFTPQADSDLIVFGGGFRGSAVTTDPTIIDSVGLTWTPLIAPVVNDPGSGARMVARSWRVSIGSSPVAMTVTVAGNTTNIASALSITGAASDFSNIDGDTSIVTAVTPVLGSSPVASSTVLGWAWTNTSGAWNTTSGYTDLVDATFVATTRLLSCYDAGSASATFAATNTNTVSRGVGIALEVKEASGGAVTGTVAASAQVVAAISGSPAITGTVAASAQVAAVIAARGVVTGTVGAAVQVTCNASGTVGGAVDLGLPPELLQSPFIANLGRMM